MKTKKVLKVNLYDIKTGSPPNKKWSLCIVKDYDSKKKLVRTGYYEDGTLWADEGEKAYGLGDVLWWIPVDEIET